MCITFCIGGNNLTNSSLFDEALSYMAILWVVITTISVYFNDHVS